MDKICQRCGNSYKVKSLVTNDIRQSLLNVVNKTNDKSIRITDFIDLCPDCVNSFRTWLKCKD